VITYGELRASVQAVAAWIRTGGHEPGSRIGILADNGAFFVSVYLGAIHAGMVAVPMNTGESPETLSRLLRQAGVSLLIASRKRTDGLNSTALECPIADEGFFKSVSGNATPAELNGGADLAALMFTSGSTGDPRAVMVTHRNIECNTADITSYLGLTSADKALLVLPLHYCFGLSVLHTHLLAGACVVFNNHFQYAESVLQDLAKHECTNFAGVPSTFQFLLRKSRLKSASLPRLRLLQQAGGRLPNPLIEELVEALPHARFITMYGQTEATARLSFLPPERLRDKLGSIGQGLPSTRLQVLKPDGQPVSPGSEEIGEIVASGDNICAGYWNDPDESARYFRDGRLFTGDLARVDADGFIHIVDRERDMIKSGGNRVSSREVEDVIASHPEVVEVAVVGVPHEWLGEAIEAFIVAKQDARLDAEAIRSLCRATLPPHKVPEAVHFLSDLPHNSSGKVIKRDLRKLAGAPAKHESAKTL
jgi:acyl-CoA synthetase (AMP-forming)/AMP-acid ligase II